MPEDTPIVPVDDPRGQEVLSQKDRIRHDPATAAGLTAPTLRQLQENLEKNRKAWILRLENFEGIVERGNAITEKIERAQEKARSVASTPTSMSDSIRSYFESYEQSSALFRERLEEVSRIAEKAESALINHATDIEAYRIKFLGAKGSIKALMAGMRDLAPVERKAYGLVVNEVKQLAEQSVEVGRAKQASAKTQQSFAGLDLSRPGEPLSPGGRHPVNLVLDRIVGIFERLGFGVVEDREIEDDWHNFTAMNTPEDHPARDMQDTFYVRGPEKLLLRTHTSSVQARTMTSQAPPIRIIAPGRVYRNETISARSHAQFHQVEGLYIDEGVSFADLKQTLLHFAREMYGPDAKIRMRPSYFPFTEPSAEVDVWWGLADEHAHRITKGTGWLEILGCGMVDPQVLTNCGIDPEKYSGFAFGMGIERQAMLQYRITDIRALFENDVRFLESFSGSW